MSKQQILYQTANFMGEGQDIFSMVSCFIDLKEES